MVKVSFGIFMPQTYIHNETWKKCSSNFMKIDNTISF